MSLLTKEQILNAEDSETKIVEVPEWGGEVQVTNISAKERDAWEVGIAEAKDKGKPVDVRASLCAKSIVNETGNRIFTDADIKKLGNKSAAALERVFTVAADLSKLNPADIEELEGN